jgi:hypothetical protein
MKKIFQILGIGLAMLLTSSNANAIIFDFTDSPGVTLLNSSYSKSFLVVPYNPLTDTLTLNSASLIISMRGLQDKVAGINNVNDDASVYSTFSGNTLIGNLTSTANENSTVIDAFNLASLLGTIEADNGNFKATVQETTAGNKWLDGAVLNSIRFTGDYSLTAITQEDGDEDGHVEPVIPEPATMSLVGLGMLSLLGLCPRKRAARK